MQEADISESLTYISDEPNINHLRHAYEQTVNELEPYFDLCRDSYDNRRNYWAGKSRDQRKHRRTNIKVSIIVDVIPESCECNSIPR